MLTRSCFLVCLLYPWTSLSASEPKSHTEPAAVAVTGNLIRVNTVGFLPVGPKRATIAAACGEFQVVRVADGVGVFSGKASAPVMTAQSDTAETVQVADFSALTAPGRYRIEVAEVGCSAAFTIAADVWNEPFKLVTRGFYLWRCGTAVSGEHDGQNFEHPACHLEDGWLDKVGGGHVQHASPGGWHDAGDYNKYVVNAGVSVGLLLKAWEQFPAAVRATRLDIPESANAAPDLLDEVRWELEWLFTMQRPDGQVYHKLSALNFKHWGRPETDVGPRYFSPCSTAAAASFVAMMAQAARVYQPLDDNFSSRCLAAAKVSWNYLLAHPEDVQADLRDFKTGGYESADVTHRLWAAAELWETTGEAAYLREFESRAKEAEFGFGGPGWGDVRDLGLGTYLLSRHGGERDAALVARLQKSLFEQTDRMIATAEANPHGRPLGGERSVWFWGCNGNVAGQPYLLYTADQLRPDPRLRETAQQSLAFLFGRNFHARSYVTGLGANPPQHPHDRRGDQAWPGYLVGGGWPDGRSWVDEKLNYRVNEIAINWNAALVYALAAFVEPKAGLAAWTNAHDAH